jgi:UDP-N-acetylglucosamine:LPS N-acetylglucosamine transferase
MKRNTIFLFYGEGGHKAEMESLLHLLLKSSSDIDYIGLAEGKAVIKTIKNYRLIPMRSKYNEWFALFLVPCAIFYNTFKFLLGVMKYQPQGIISTGPGSVLLPAILCRILRIKIVYIENGSRFYTKSMTGKFMYFISDRFYVQRVELLKLYPRAIYAGLL